MSSSPRRVTIVALALAIAGAFVVAAWNRDPARPADAGVPRSAPPEPTPVATATVSDAPEGSRAPAQDTLRARLVFPDGRPLRGCVVHLWLDHATAPETVTSDAAGDLECTTTAACGTARMQVDWGPNPLQTTRSRDDRAPVWDLGEIAVPLWSEVLIRVVIDEPARPLLADQGAVALWADLALGVYPTLPALMAARQEGKVQRVVVPLSASAVDPGERRAWLRYDGPLQTYLQLKADQARTGAPIARCILHLAEPGRYEALEIRLRGEDFVVGHVVWSDGTPAEGVTVEAWSDTAKQNQLPFCSGRAMRDGHFSLFAPGSMSGGLTAIVGRARFEQTYALGTDNRIELPLRRDAVVMVRVVDSGARPVARSGVFQLNRIQRTTAGQFEQEALLDERAVGTPNGLHILAVDRVRRGERWYIVTPAFGEVAYTFECDVVPGTVVDVPAIGNGPPARTVRIELPTNTAVNGEAMLMLKEQSARGDPGTRYWLRCQEAFQRGFVEIEHVYPGVHRIEVSGAPRLALPEVRVD